MHRLHLDERVKWMMELIETHPVLKKSSNQGEGSAWSNCWRMESSSGQSKNQEENATRWNHCLLVLGA